MGQLLFFICIWHRAAIDDSFITINEIIMVYAPVKLMADHVMMVFIFKADSGCISLSASVLGLVS